MTFAPLRPLIPYNVPEPVRQAEQDALDRGLSDALHRGLSDALQWLKAQGITGPRFKEHTKESGT